MFTRKQLMKLIIPLVIEQLLAVTVGLAAMVMVTSAGEAAIAGVSLVDTLNVLLISLFTALATGGAVVSAQYLGHKDKEQACLSANQLLLSSILISLIIMAVALVGNRAILRMIYGNIGEEVMYNARIYFYLTALSFPFLAIYNSCAALFRAMGNSKISMWASFIMNVINIIGNGTLVYGFHMGIVGVAIPTLISRAVAAAIIFRFICNKKYPVHIEKVFKQGFEWKMIKRILHIGIPNGLENSIFQIGKILVQSLITSFGTAALAANAVANSIATIEIIPGSAMGLAMITIIGQCVGAGDYNQAKKYAKKLMVLSYAMLFLVNSLAIVFYKSILGIFSLSHETYAITVQLVIFHSICCAIIWSASFTLPNALRAAGDVKFTLLTSIVSMWIFRIALSYLLGRYLGLGVLGVWIAMIVDWCCRSISFVIRFIRGKWKHPALIS